MGARPTAGPTRVHSEDASTRCHEMNHTTSRIPGRLSRGGMGRRERGGFILIELILVLFILTLLCSVGVLAVASWVGEDDLEEGAAQWAAAMVTARAEAAMSGRRIRMSFEAAAGDERGVSWRMQWEADPLGEPGVFVPIERPWVERMPYDRVAVVSSTLTGSSGYAHAAVEDTLGSRQGEPLHPVIFYPNGRSDSARFVLISRARGDERYAVIELDGLSGPSPVRVYAPDALPYW